jgi:hypothetical protein
MRTSLVGVVIASSSSSDGRMFGLALAARIAFAAVAHLVDLSPFCYLELRPDQDLDQFPHYLPVLHQDDLT